MSCRRVCQAIVVLAPIAVHAANAQETTSRTSTAESAVDFIRDVAPILSEKCVSCHGATMQMADFRIDRKSSAFESGEAGGAIEPGDSEASYLILRLHDSDEGILMPPTGKLSDVEIESLRRWIDQGANWPDDVQLSTKDAGKDENEQQTELFHALRDGNANESLRLLKAHPELVTVTDSYGATPLMYAALFGAGEVLEAMLEAGANVNHADQDGATALMWGIRDISIVRPLIERGADVNARSQFGRTPLMIAACHPNNGSVVTHLIDAGANVSELDKRQADAVSLAIATGDLELVKLLVASGADVTRTIDRGEEVRGTITSAAFLNDLSMVRWLLEQGVRGPVLNRALVHAATNGSSAMVKGLLHGGADAKRRFGNKSQLGTALIAAAYTDYQNPAIMELLLEHGADPTVRDERDRTAFDYAMRRTNSRTTELLAKPAEEPRYDLEDALTRCVRLLQDSSREFFRKSGCVACHQHSVTSFALKQARRVGIPFDEESSTEQMQLTGMVQGERRGRFLQRISTGGAGHTVGYLLLGMAADGYPADKITDACVIELAGLQTHDGGWYSHAHRPPTEYSRISATAVAAHAMQLYAPPALETRIRAQVARARDWLSRAPASTNQELAFRLLGLKWTHAPVADVEQAAEQLLQQQRQDGGWAQFQGIPSDAYATGLALYALHVGGGLRTDDSAYRHAARYLVQTQHQDGSWHVVSRAYKFQPYFESGFPYHHDQWISAAATGWAATALMFTLDTD